MRRWGWRGLATLLLLLAGAATYPGADLAAFAARASRSGQPAGPAPPGSLPWLHVEPPASGRPFIADPEGRQVILRGSVVAGLVDWWSGRNPADLAPAPLYPIDRAAYENGCPANSDLIRVPPVCRNDFEEMRRLGFDVVRLGLSWSLLEPQPGRYDQRYIDRVAQVVGWARDNGIYVILDMHQDAYSRYLPRPDPPPLPYGLPPALHDHDGAPAWAVYTDGLPSERFIGQREMNPAVGDMTTSFWLNRGGLQDHYIGAVAALARRFRDDSAVAGYNLLNEPWPGFFDSPYFDDLFLMPFYRRAIDAITGVRDGLPCPASAPALAACGYPDLGIHDRRHLVFVEANHLRGQTDFDLHLPLALSSYPNIVYAIHTYTHKFTFDAIFNLNPSAYPPGGYELSYDSAEAAARSLDAALFVTEYGNEPSLDGKLLVHQLAEQEQHLVGSTYWPWKENCDSGITWGLYEGVFGPQPDQRCADQRGGSAAASAPQNGCLRASKERLLARVWPRAVAGTLRSYRYDPDTGVFAMDASAPKGSPDSVVYLPPEVTGAVESGGAAQVRSVQDLAGGGRLAMVQPLGGAYSVRVTPAPLRLAACG